MKPLLKIAGLLLSLAGLIYLFYALDMSAVIPALENVGAMRFMLLSIGYGGALLIIMYVWIRLLSVDRQHWPLLMPVYAQSVMTKYIPGGIFQYASRQISLIERSKDIGLTQMGIARASLCEILLHVAAASLMSLLFFWQSGPDRLPGTLPEWVAQCGPYLLLLMAVASVAPVIYFHRARKTVFLLTLQSLFFIAMAGLSYEIASLLLKDSLDPFYLAFVFMISWVAGFIVIGSPGGLGVREAAIIFLLQERCGAADAAAIALTIRLMTSMGDLVFSGSIFLLQKKLAEYLAKKKAA